LYPTLCNHAFGLAILAAAELWQASAPHCSWLAVSSLHAPGVMSRWVALHFIGGPDYVPGEAEVKTED